MGQMMSKGIQATWPCSVDIACLTKSKNSKNKKNSTAYSSFLTL